MSKITPLPKELGEDLNALKELIDERLVAISANSESISSIMLESDEFRAEVKILQDEIQILSGAKVRENKQDVVELIDGVRYMNGKALE